MRPPQAKSLSSPMVASESPATAPPTPVWNAWPSNVRNPSEKSLRSPVESVRRPATATTSGSARSRACARRSGASGSTTASSLTKRRKRPRAASAPSRHPAAKPTFAAAVIRREVGWRRRSSPTGKPEALSTTMSSDETRPRDAVSSAPSASNSCSWSRWCTTTTERSGFFIPGDVSRARRNLRSRRPDPPGEPAPERLAIRRERHPVRVDPRPAAPQDERPRDAVPAPLRCEAPGIEGGPREPGGVGQRLDDGSGERVGGSVHGPAGAGGGQLSGERPAPDRDRRKAAPRRVEEPGAVSEVGFQSLRRDRQEDVCRGVEVGSRVVRQPGGESDRPPLRIDLARAAARFAVRALGCRLRVRAREEEKPRRGHSTAHLGPGVEKEAGVVPVVDPAKEDEGAVFRNAGSAPARTPVSGRRPVRHAKRDDAQKVVERRIGRKVRRPDPARREQGARVEEALLGGGAKKVVGSREREVERRVVVPSGLRSHGLRVMKVFDEERVVEVRYDGDVRRPVE